MNAATAIARELKAVDFTHIATWAGFAYVLDRQVVLRRAVQQAVAAAQPLVARLRSRPAENPRALGDVVIDVTPRGGVLSVAVTSTI